MQGIFWGVVFEISPIIGQYLGAVSIGSIGRLEFLELSAFVIAVGIVVAYGTYLERQANTRYSKWYRGF